MCTLLSNAIAYKILLINSICWFAFNEICETNKKITYNF